MVDKTRYLKVKDLYIRGTAVVAQPEGEAVVFWLQVMSKFERTEAQMAANTARARLQLALDEFGSPELAVVQAQSLIAGREVNIETLLGAKEQVWGIKAAQNMQDDPKFRERWDIIARGQEILLRPEQDPERRLLVQFNQDYMRRINEFIAQENEYEQSRLEQLSDDELQSEIKTFYLEKRGNELALLEYQVHELFYAARVCQIGVVEGKASDLAADHRAAGCDHSVRVFDDPNEVRLLPDDLWDALRSTLSELTMTARDARFSARQGISSEPSPLPSEPAASESSTPTESKTAPGL